jgi:hypothetical protein
MARNARESVREVCLPRIGRDPRFLFWYFYTVSKFSISKQTFFGKYFYFLLGAARNEI